MSRGSGGYGGSQPPQERRAYFDLDGRLTAVKAILDAITGTEAPVDHGALLGLGDDDHSQYALTDGTRGNFDALGAATAAQAAAQSYAVTQDEIRATAAATYTDDAVGVEAAARSGADAALQGAIDANAADITSGDAAVQANLDAHLTDPTDAHDGSAISFDGTALAPVSQAWHPTTIVDVQDSIFTIITEIDSRSVTVDTAAVIDALNAWTGGDPVITASSIFNASLITSDVIAAGAIATSKLAANAVTTAKLDALAVTADKIAANTITASQIAAGTISATEIAAGAVTTAKLSTDAVKSTNYVPPPPLSQGIDVWMNVTYDSAVSTYLATLTDLDVGSQLGLKGDTVFVTITGIADGGTEQIIYVTPDPPTLVMDPSTEAATVYRYVSYPPAGSFFDLAQGDIYSPGLLVDSSSGRVFVRGEITADALSIFNSGFKVAEFGSVSLGDEALALMRGDSFSGGALFWGTGYNGLRAFTDTGQRGQIGVDDSGFAYMVAHASWAATERTVVLDTSGNLTLTAARILNTDGSAAFPAYSFATDENTGMYRAAENILAFSTAGGERVQVNTNGIQFPAATGRKIGMYGTSTAFELGVGGGHCYMKGNDYCLVGGNGAQIRLGEWSQSTSWDQTVQGDNGYLLLGSTGGAGPIYLRTDTAQPVYIGSNDTNDLYIQADHIIVARTTFASSSTGTTSGSNLRYGGFGIFYYYSSNRWRKERINPQTAEEAGEIIDALRPVTFIEKYLGEEPEDPMATKWREADQFYGFIAEEVYEVANGHLSTIDHKKTAETGEVHVSGWDGEQVISVLVAEVQALRKRVAALEAEA